MGSAKELLGQFRGYLASLGHKSRETVEIAKLRREQGSLRKNIRLKKEELGDAVYQAYLYESSEALEKEYGREVCREIRKMEIELEKLEEKISELTSGKAATPMTCSYCSESISPGDQFCRQCGKRAE